jgi:putative NADH-flavin reductase
MNIAIVGASGRAGSAILRELVARGHRVTAIARQSERILLLPGVRLQLLDATDLPVLTNALRGHDVVVSAAKFSQVSADTLIAAVKGGEVPRYLVVGGAGSLLDECGGRLVDRADFPEAYRPEALRGAEFLERLRGESGLDWTFLSPGFQFVEGERTGTFRIGGDTALTVPDGPTRISFADFAIAMSDEIEAPRHRRQRFSVAY